MRKAVVAGLVGFGLLAGCVSPATYQKGSPTLMEMRDARTSVTVYDDIPAAAKNLNEIAVERCNQTLAEAFPSEELLQDDLIIAAYAQGADGISNIKHTEETGLLRNCWNLRTATATVFRLP